MIYIPNPYVLFVLLPVLSVLPCSCLEIPNSRVIIDMVQNNPGDAVGWQQTRYFDPKVLKSIGYTGQSTTGEMSGTQAVDFSSLGHDFFPANSSQRLWLDAYAMGVQRFVESAVAAGVAPYFFVDLLVFPVAVIDAYPGATHNGKLVWNVVTERLLQVLVNETFTKFSDVAGWIVRTGETYVYDTPYHAGNSPSNGTMDGWVSFITALREFVCVRAGKQLFFRAWDNWPSSKDYYVTMTNRIEPHPLLYFSIKHSAGDFTRPAEWNPTLGTGIHAQICEVELQREYEGKASYPNYVMNGVIDGFPEMNPRIGLKDVIHAPQLKGLWTWTRGGGWWGPYIHGKEYWVDLHVHVLVPWWLANGTLSEKEVFASSIPKLFAGCDSSACISAFRHFALTAADIVLHGQWGTVSSCMWMRDDRIGGIDQASACLNPLGSNDGKWTTSIQEKQMAMASAAANLQLFQDIIRPSLTDLQLANDLTVSTLYAVHLYNIVYYSWILIAVAYRSTHHMPPLPPLPQNNSEIKAAIAQYDGAFAAYRAFGLAETTAASLYHPYFLCLGVSCNGAFSPPPCDFQRSSIEGKNAYGIGYTVDQLRGSGF